MTLSSGPNQANLFMLKSMARFYINENRLEEALDIYISILSTYPEDVEVLMALGNLYLAVGNGQTAERLFRQAQQVGGVNPVIERQIQLASDEYNPDVAEESVPTSPEAVNKLLQLLTHRDTPVPEEEMQLAADLLNLIIHSNNPAIEVAAHLDEITDLLPALLDLNIRQARADGRPDLAQSLHNLKTNITLQKSNKKVAKSQEKESQHFDQFIGKVLILKPDFTDNNGRLKYLAKALEAQGCQVSQQLDMHDRPDVAVVSNAFCDTRLLEAMASLSAMGVPLILDMDKDYENLPVNHVEYSQRGIHSPSKGRAFASAMVLADTITVPSDHLAESFRSAGYPVFCITEGWSADNPFWRKPSSAHPMLTIGWFGHTGALEDLASIRRVLIRLLREFEDTLRLIIVGDPEAYRMFDTVPEKNRLYLPYISEEEYPYILSQMDILVVPYRKSPFNLSRSDEILMQAGVKRIPWVASKIPAFLKWSKGGLFADTQEEWHTNLRHIVLEADIRTKLGEDGSRVADRREMHRHVAQWLEAINIVVTGKQEYTLPEVNQ